MIISASLIDDSVDSRVDGSVRSPVNESVDSAADHGASGVARSGPLKLSFPELGLCDEIAAALARKGITTPFPIQVLAIPDVLAGRDVCGKAKTGSGKTLAFGLPLLQRMGRAEPGAPTGLILAPTRELANQICNELAPAAQAVSRRVLAVYGGARIEAQTARLRKGVDLMVATPGRMIDLIGRGEVTVSAVRHVVVDEADRMADMGFLPQVEWILCKVDSTRQTLLFSATLDGAVNALINRYQSDPAMIAVTEPEINVAEMTHRFVGVHKLDKVKVTAAIAEASQRTLVFTRTKAAADRLARDLLQEGVNAAPIHGDLRQTAREKSLGAFMAGRLPVLVATDVAARGIHVDDVEVVVQYDPPGDHKTYLHRAGRTARAGESGVVVTLSLWDQELEVKRLQRRVGLDQPIVEMFSNDPRLRDLAEEPTR